MQLSSLSLAITNILGAGRFDPASWFAAGEQGAWYDPSDFTTLFQDSAGTIPVTAVEQPVGLMLDKSQSLALGNEIIVNGNFATDTWWTKSAASITIAGGVGVATSAANGEGWYRTGVLTTNTFYEITFTVVSCSSGGFYVWQAGAQTVRSTPGTYTVRVLATQAQVGILCSGVTTGTIDNISYKQVTGNHAFQATAGNRPTLSARVNILLATGTLSTQTVTTLATTYTLSFTGTGTITLTGTATGVYTAGTYSITCTAGSLVVTVAGLATTADLRPANIGTTLPSYQRIAAATDYDTAGFPLYLKTNGISSAMQTNSIDFTATDKMTIVTGVRRLGSDRSKIILEFTPLVSNTGGVAIYENDLTTGDYNFQMQNGYRYSALSAPSSNVLSVNYDRSQISTNLQISPRINGAVPTLTSSGSPVAASNFVSNSLYLFARNNGASLWFNGQFYGAIICGASKTTAEIQQAESYENQKAGGLY